jgi:hypothetical protein
MSAYAALVLLRADLQATALHGLVLALVLSNGNSGKDTKMNRAPKYRKVRKTMELLPAP